MRKTTTGKYDKRFKPDQREILTKKERLKLLLACETFEELLFVRIGLNTGLRLSEILNLTPANIVYEENQVRVIKGKGGKNRWSCCDTPTITMLKAYINDRKIGENEKILNKSPRTYQIMMQRLTERAGIKRVNITPHTLRHTNITMLLERKMPVVEVKEHAGHSDISTTMIYTHLTYAPIRNTYMDIMGE